MATDLATMTDAEKIAAYEASVQGTKANSGPARYLVKVSLKTGSADRVLFSSVSQARAKKWIEDHCPRGSHFYLENPDGSMLAYEADRATGGPQGEDLDTWQTFNRDEYQAPELSPVNVNDPWADAWEGAQ
jgi:hypothetical protein